MPDKLIRVEFVDAATQKIFGVNESPPDLLPETFVLNTKVSIQDQEWQVVKAEPMTRAEYVKLGKLTLTLSKIVMMPVKDILYTLPTFYDPLPAMREAPPPAPDENVYVMHADFWRCVEFVPTSYHSDIEKECLGVANIHEHHREAGGFNELYIRKGPSAPMAGTLTLTELRAQFAGSQPFEAIVFDNEPGRTASAFAFLYGIWVIYGDHTNGAVQSLALQPHRQVDVPVLPLDPFLTLMRVYNLYLVDWLNANPMTEPEADIFLNRFQQQ